MSYLTLEYNGSERTLAAWGFALDSAQAQFQSLATDTLRLVAPEADVSAAAAIPFEGWVILRSGRASATGDTNTFTGGTVEFQGWRLNAPVSASGEEQSRTYEFAGPWYLLEHTTFQQAFQSWIGPGDLCETLYNSAPVLFTKYTATPFAWVRIQTKEQIDAILNYALARFVADFPTAPTPFAVGTIEPDVAVPTYQIREVTCAEAIALCLRVAPDAVAWFDYSTTPPTFHVKKRASLTPVTLAYAAGGQVSLQITPRHDLLVRSVVLSFEQTHSADAFTWVTSTVQKYGLNGADNAADPDAGLRVLVQSVDLAGSSVTTVSAQIESASMAVLSSGTNLEKRAWWEERVAEFKDHNAVPLLVDAAANVRFASVTVVDRYGNAVSLAEYPYELLGGGVAPWMFLADGVTPVAAIEAEIRVMASYRELDSDNADIKVADWEDTILQCTLTLTNAPSGWYRAVDTAVAAEEVPAGLAQALYESLATLQYEGRDVRVANDPPSSVSLGCALNLSGGAAEWATMNAQVRAVAKHYGHGFAEVAIGPVQPLSAQTFTELHNFNRFRAVYQNPRTRATAQR